MIKDDLSDCLDVSYDSLSVLLVLSIWRFQAFWKLWVIQQVSNDNFYVITARGEASAGIEHL